MVRSWKVDGQVDGQIYLTYLYLFVYLLDLFDLYLMIFDLNISLLDVNREQVHRVEIIHLHLIMLML